MLGGLLGLFTLVALVAALASSIASPNLAHAHSPGGATLTALAVTADGTAQTLSPTFSSTVYSYTVLVESSVTQVTVTGTPGGDGSVTAAQQVTLPTVGATRVSVVVSHTDSGTTTTQTYTVKVVRDGTVETDRAALMALYNSLGGVNWTRNDRWGGPDGITHWAGVFTHEPGDNDGRVRYLYLGGAGFDCSGDNLVGTLPAAIGNLNAMEDLYLCGNRISGPLPDSIGDLVGLQRLWLNGNQLTGTIPDSLGDLTNLDTLSLWNNQFSGALPDSLGNLASLRWLYLGGNAFTGAIPDSLGSLASLQALSLWDNDLSEQLPDSLGSLTALTSLDISRNRLDGSIPDLGRLTSLQYLYLWDNQLSGEIPATLNSLTGLKQLYLNRNGLSGSIPTLSSLTNLTHLYLNHNGLTGSIPASLGSLTSLQELALAYNQLSGEIPATLNSLTNLRLLHAEYNRLSGEIPTLSSLTSLEGLWLHNNDLTGGIPAWLGSLTNLTHLSLQSNQLDGAIPNLSSLEDLELLSLLANDLTGPIPAWLRQLTDLEYLFLSDNQLSGDFPSGLGSLTNLKVTRFASNPSLTGCVPISLRYLVSAPDFESEEFDPERRPLNIPAQDFIPDDANGDGDTDDVGDTPGLHLPFCMVQALTFSSVSLAPAFATGTVAYTASVANTVESTTVTVTLPAGSSDRLSIRKGTASYTSGAAVPLAVGQNEITITVSPTDGTPTLTYTVAIFREGVDRATLTALYNSTGGASWTSKTNWGETGVAIGMWEGVTTDANSRVTMLELPGNNLSGPLLDALGSLTSLTTLDLSGNRMSGTVPDFTSLTSLTTLKLGDNQLTGTIPDWLGSLTGLQELSLRDNRFTGAIPEELRDLTVLDILYLDGNRLSGPIPAALGDLTGLQATRFAGNNLTGCVPNGLRYLVTAPVFNSLPAHDFIAVDANDDGDTGDDGDTPGLGLPFCTLRSLTLSGVTLDPAFASDVVIYTAAADHGVTSTTVTAGLNDSSDTVSIVKGVDTYMSGNSVPLDVGENEITVTVTTTDDTPTPHTYAVTVTRKPNAPPFFDDSPTTTRGVDENTAAGVDIGDPVAATDDDNDTLTHSLDAAGAASFDIDASSGQLQTKAALDHETKSTYTVTVSVSDSKDNNGDTNDVRDDTISVKILVADINEAPEFPSATGERGLDENTSPGVNIGAPFSADDDDGDTLTYSLDTAGAGSFDIVAATGQLQTKAALNFETTPSYTVTVTAADPIGAKDTITVTITVKNVEEAGTVTLSSTQPIIGTPVTATLNDPDGNLTDIFWYWEHSSRGTSPWITITTSPQTTASATYSPEDGFDGRHLRARVTYTDEFGSGKSANAVFANPVLAESLEPNDPPQFPAATGTRDVDENTRAGVDIGEPVAATDSENDTLTYSLDSPGTDVFDIVSTTGQLRTRAALDHETTPSYTVTVTATDTAGGTDDVVVIITVNNVDEPGSVTLSTLQPLVAIQLTATLDDPDVVLGSVTWSWARSPNGATDWAQISGEEFDTYTPIAGDVGYYLRATAAYTDGEGSDKTAPGISANLVEVALGRKTPVLREHPTATRSVPRNTPAGRNIGAPFTATDADNDLLIYSLGGPDAAGFDIDTSNGQLLTKALLTGNNRTTYKVFVSVSDGKDDLGNPEAVPQIDATTEVTINLTTSGRTTTGGSSGGGFGPAPVAPKFGDGFRTTRTVAQNARAGDAVGDPVSATHPEDLEITYSLSGADAALFTVDEETGQIRANDGVGLILGTTYTANLTATDSAGFGAIIIVVIEVVEAGFHRYDLNKNGLFERNEVLQAIADYFAGRIDKNHVLEIISAYFGQ